MTHYKERLRLLGLAALLTVLVVAIVWYRFAPSEAPPGQRPLATLDSTSLQTLRADFNRDVSQARIIVLLSPT